MKYIVGYPIKENESFLNTIIQNKNSISEVYFSWGDFPNGRSSQLLSDRYAPWELQDMQRQALLAGCLSTAEQALIEYQRKTAELIGDTGTVYPINAGTRNRFAYVPQENSIFTGTIAHNLRIVAPEATEEEMVEALKVACAWEFVQQLPEGLNHPLSTGGRGVSEGQAQRLAIARALLKGAPILLLDEATSALDEETEAKVLANLRRLNDRTVVIVTHRKAALDICNRIVEMDAGSFATLFRYAISVQHVPKALKILSKLFTFFIFNKLNSFLDFFFFNF